MEQKYFQDKKSKRLVESGEVLELISAAGSGISTRTLQNFTGNQLRSRLTYLHDSRLVKLKKIKELSRQKSNIYYTTKKISITRIKELELLSYAVWFLRNCGLRVGKVTIAESGNILATAAINEEEYTLLEFVAINARNYFRKLTSLNNSKKTQKVLVMEGDSVQNLVKKSEGKDNITIVKFKKDNDIYLRGAFNNDKDNYISKDFDFSQLMKIEGKAEVDKILNGYKKCAQLRERCAFGKKEEEENG